MHSIFFIRRKYQRLRQFFARRINADFLHAQNAFACLSRTVGVVPLHQSEIPSWMPSHIGLLQIRKLFGVVVSDERFDISLLRRFRVRLGQRGVQLSHSSCLTQQCLPASACKMSVSCICTISLPSPDHDRCFRRHEMSVGAGSAC